MKTFNRTSLPESIKYNGLVYSNDLTLANLCKSNNGKIIETYVEINSFIEHKNAVIVKVLPRNLKGKTDLYNQPYQPTEWIYSCKF